MKQSILSERKLFLLLVIVASLLFLMTPIIRTLKFDGLYPGTEPYYNAMMAEYIANNGIPRQEPLMSRPYILEPYHILLSLFVPIMGVYSASILIPFLLGLFSVILIYSILTKFSFSPIKKFTIGMIFVLSPVSLYLFSTSNSYAFAIFVFLLGFYLLIKESLLYLPVFALLALFNPLFSLAAIFFLFSYYLYDKKSKRRFYTAMVIIGVTSLIYYTILYIKFGLPNLIDIEKSNIIIRSISDFGAKTGFGIFHFMLFLFGVYSLWNAKKQKLIYLLFLILIILSAYYTPLNVYLNLILCFAAGYGFLAFIDRKWEILTLKKLTILILVCGLLFSSLSYINRISGETPHKETLKSLEWFLKQPNGITLSHYSNGYWVEAIANKTPLLDENKYYLRDVDAKFNSSNEIFQSRNLKNTRELLDQYNISYIFITSQMKEGEVWKNKEDGLLFLLRNNETFKNLYSSKDSEIWKVIR